MAFKKYFEFSGRSRRKEYWMFLLFNILAGFVMGLFKMHIYILTVYQLVILVPSISLGVRRCHDVDHKGWWLMLPIYNFVLMCFPGTIGPNRFGADPKNT